MGDSLPGVLVVDDEPRSLETLRRTLEDEFQVLTTENAARAYDDLGEIHHHPNTARQPLVGFEKIATSDQLMASVTHQLYQTLNLVYCDMHGLKH